MKNSHSVMTACLQRVMDLFTCPGAFAKTIAAGSSWNFHTPDITIEMRVQRGRKRNTSGDEVKSMGLSCVATNEDMSLGDLRYKAKSLDHDKGIAVPKEV